MRRKWLKIIGFENLYSISNLGEVRRDSGTTNTYKGKILRNIPDRKNGGYLFVCLSKNNKKFNKRIHQLVARNFIGKVPKEKEINHIDGNKYNNNLKNLEYVTTQENSLHARMIGLKPIGERHYRAKLTQKQVDLIRTIHACGFLSRYKLSNIFNVSTHCIKRIVEKRSWKGKDGKA